MKTQKSLFSEKSTFQESGMLKDYMNPPKDLHNGDVLKLGAKDLQTNLESAFNQMKETIIRVMVEQSDLQAPGLFDAFMNEVKAKTKELQSVIDREYRQLKSK